MKINLDKLAPNDIWEFFYLVLSTICTFRENLPDRSPNAEGRGR